MTSVTDPLSREHLLVVGAGATGPRLMDALRGLYPDWTVSSCDTYLSAIAETAQRRPRAVIGWVDASLPRLSSAVAGLRESVGEKSRVILCCLPRYETEARRAVTAGADDYVLYPLEAKEVDAAVAYARSIPVSRGFSNAASASMEELRQLDRMIADLDARPMALIERIAGLVHTALPTRGVTVVVQGAVATAGDVVNKPVLSAPLTADGAATGAECLGHINVGEPVDAPFTPGDTEKLNHYAKLASTILAAASARRSLRRLAVTDECTGLPNRRYLHDRLDEILRGAASEKFPVTLLMFDVDDFKRYNDNHGHPAGDEILRIIGELFSRHCREQDIVTRYGGDEFAVVFWDADGPRTPGSKHPANALSVLDRVREALKTHPFPMLDAGVSGSLTISGGLATYPWDGRTRDELIASADGALLAAKRAGKNRILLIGEDAGP